MNILFWCDGFWPRLGGIETQTLAFIQQMKKNGHQFRVIAQKDHPAWKEREIHEGIQIDRFDFNQIIQKKELKTIGEIQQSVLKILEEFRPDLIHLNTLVGGSLFAFFLLRPLFLFPIVLTAYSSSLHQGKLPLLVSKTLSLADRICCISDWVMHEIKPHLPHLSSKFQRIYCGLPPPKIEAAPLKFSPPTLVTFGRLSSEKGFETAIRAVPLLKKRGTLARLIVAGGGRERAPLERLAQELGVADSIHFAGILSSQETDQLFNQASIVIAPSIHESFGLVILEAMQRGRPVIASRTEAIPEVVDEGETALLFPPKDQAKLAEAIQILLNNPQKAELMGLKGKARAAQFSLDRTMVEYEKVYEELLG